MTEHMQDKRIRKRTLFSVFCIAFLDNYGFSLVLILFAPLVLNPDYGFFTAELSEGTKNILLGVLLAAFPISTFFGAPFWGDYGDRFGRKKAFIFTIGGTTLGHLLCALAIFSKSYVFLFLARAMAGFFSGNISICLATISDLSPNPKIKAQNFGIWTVILGIGWVIAMVMGGYFSDRTVAPLFNPAFPFFIAAILSFLGYVVIALWFTESHERKEGVHFHFMKSVHEIKAALQHTSIRPYLLMLFFWYFGWFSAFQWITAISIELYGKEQQTVSLYLIILGIVWMVGGILVNRILVRKYSSPILSLVTLFLITNFIFTGGMVHDFFIFFFFFWLAALVGPVVVSNNLNIVSSAAPKSVQGKAMGFTQSVQAIAAMFVPFAGGLIAKADIGWIFPVGSASIFIAFLILLMKYPSLKSQS